MFSYLYNILFGSYKNNLIREEYKGDIFNNIRQGKGQLKVYENRKILEEYKGEFVNNKKEGYGELIKEGLYYKGMFKNDKMEGEGYLELKHKDEFGNHTEIYNGEFFNNLKHGRGKLITKMQDNSFKTICTIYVGQFVSGYRHGEGELITDKNITQGIWLNDNIMKLNTKVIQI